MTDESNITNPIQPMKEEDIDEVCKIWLIGSLTSHGFIPAGFWYSKLHNIRQSLSDTTKKKYVYKENGIIKGFIILSTRTDQSIGYIDELFVDLPYQKNDIGTNLLKQIKKDKDYKALELNVYQLNTGAIIFYAKRGFRIKKEQENCVYLEPETGQWKLLMICDKCKKEDSQSSR